MTFICPSPITNSHSPSMFFWADPIFITTGTFRELGGIPAICLFCQIWVSCCKIIKTFQSFSSWTKWAARILTSTITDCCWPNMAKGANPIFFGTTSCREVTRIPTVSFFSQFGMSFRKWQLCFLFGHTWTVRLLTDSNQSCGNKTLIHLVTRMKRRNWRLSLCVPESP